MTDTALSAAIRSQEPTTLCITKSVQQAPGTVFEVNTSRIWMLHYLADFGKERTFTCPSMVHTLFPERKSHTRAMPPKSPVATNAPSCASEKTRGKQHKNKKIDTEQDGALAISVRMTKRDVAATVTRKYPKGQHFPYSAGS